MYKRHFINCCLLNDLSFFIIDNKFYLIHFKKNFVLLKSFFYVDDTFYYFLPIYEFKGHFSNTEVVVHEHT